MLTTNEMRCFKALIGCILVRNKRAVKNRRKHIRFYQRFDDAEDVAITQLMAKRLREEELKINLYKSIRQKVLKNKELTINETSLLDEFFNLGIRASKGQKGQRLAIKLKEKILGNKERE
jgi:hypothetical protein